jgi:ABC-type Fe3+ transport system permease subunit
MKRRIAFRAACLVCEFFFFAYLWSMVISLTVRGALNNPETAETFIFNDTFIMGCAYGLVGGVVALIFTWAIAGVIRMWPNDVAKVARHLYRQRRGTSTVEEFREAWGQAMRGEVKPISELWKEVNQ